MVVVSPCTSTRSGVSAFKTGSSASKIRAVSAESVWPGRIAEIVVGCYLEGLQHLIEHIPVLGCHADACREIARA